MKTEIFVDQCFEEICNFGDQMSIKMNKMVTKINKEIKKKNYITINFALTNNELKFQKTMY
jgi:predicted  nucleic acid-binding Zn ribbon protein